ncbi:MAG: SigB/SigF/SigG family RNA polymerase sigma factor [Lachnospiraceae bacterium]|nr:SigB/SigF/SigG family RNA polymerase sigma factor [Lachnospiraceae bacterium]
MNDTIALIEKSHLGDKEAREVLVEENLGLVHHISKRFMGRGIEPEDLIQIGSIGLIKAIDKFDLSYDVKFSTYAVPMIMGEIKRFLRDDGMVKVSRSIKENGWKVRQAESKLSQELGRDATMEEIAEMTQLSLEDIVVAIDASREIDSIYKSVYQSDGKEIYLLDQVTAHKESAFGGESIHDDLEKDELLNRLLLEQLMEGLHEMERELIQLRYFDNITQVEVAKRLGISQVQVSRLEKKILVSMRNRLS